MSEQPQQGREGKGIERDLKMPDRKLVVVDQGEVSELAKTKSVIVLEDLHVKGMMRNEKLARHIGDAGWGEFRRMLEYKSVWYGSRLVIAPRFLPSSKTCSTCGHQLPELS